MIWSMEALQITSVEKPIDNPALLRALMPVINRAWAMGLPLPGKGQPFVLSRRSLMSILDSARRTGIGGDVSTLIRAAPNLMERDPEEAARLFSELSRAMEESPSPDTEWAPMRELLGDGELEASWAHRARASPVMQKGSARLPMTSPTAFTF
jgi:hypothetical protein